MQLASKTTPAEFHGEVIVRADEIFRDAISRHRRETGFQGSCWVRFEKYQPYQTR